ncbi:hypothetical protein UlMin_029724 [Ulmus minor]
MASLFSVVCFGVIVFVHGCAADGSSFGYKLPYDDFNRTSFPPDFVFGTASGAYQFEGAWNNTYGRGPSIWDVYTHNHPERITDHKNGDVAIDQYHRYKEDVKIMKEMNLDAYRFSISWSRLLPNGKLSGGLNPKGVQYYKNLINELLANDIEPYVTIFHWDLPQSLQNKYNGFLDGSVVHDLRVFAEVCFEYFGDRVKHWITLNEPYIFTILGYARGSFPPGRCSPWQKLNCLGGNSATEPYTVAHNLLLAHGAVVKLYKEKYQAKQKGVIGVTHVTPWFVPYSTEKRDHLAAQRALDFTLGWFMEPITYGDYPRTMRVLVGDRLPKFTKKESELLKGSFDFLGLNYYTANYARDAPQNPHIFKFLSVLTDAQVDTSTSRNGVPIGPPTGTSVFYVYPEGIYELLVYIKKKYKNPVIYITENGISEKNKDDTDPSPQLNDIQRIDFYHDHLANVLKAIKDGVRLKGYFAWTLLDNFEWASGYTVRFGINYVDYKDNLKRYQKLSFYWFRKFLQKKNKHISRSDI